MANIYSCAEELIGSTPLVELRRIKEKYGLCARILAKVEASNPAGSAKDRVAREMLNDAEEKGLISRGSVIIEPTSGNTGIGLAMLAAVRGYRAVIVMPSTMSPERIRLMEAYGAEVVLSEGSQGMTGAIALANKLAADTPNSYIPGQFDNPANPMAHYRTTGPEIYRDTDGEVDIFVAGVGTGGTVSGTGRYLKEAKPSIKIVGAEPLSSPVLSGGKPGPHGIQGIGAGFVPAVYDAEVCDEIVTVSDSDAIEYMRVLARTEGLLCGISSGCALRAAVEVAARAENAGKTVVVLLPDTGERYLSMDM